MTVRPLERSASQERLALTEYETGLPAETSALSIARTFQQLELRKLERRRTGTVSNQSAFWQAFWLLAVLAWWAGIFHVDVGGQAATDTGSNTTRSSGEMIQLSVRVRAGVILSATALFLAATTLVKLAQVARFVLYWLFLLILLMIYVVAQRDSNALRDPRILADGIRHEGLVWGLAVLIPLEFLTLFVWGVIHIGAPALLKGASEATIVRLYKLRRAPAFDLVASEGIAFSYSPPWWRVTNLRWSSSSRKEHHFFYSGQLKEGRPHGYGEWRDDASAGECMRGFWNDGKPVAPFRSRLYESGYAFEAIHIFYVTARSESVSQVAIQPRRHASPGLRFGLAAVECSVSGEFFSALPRVLILRETAPEDLAQSGAVLGSDSGSPHASAPDVTGTAAVREHPHSLGSLPPHPAEWLDSARAHNTREMLTSLSLLRHSDDEELPLKHLTVDLSVDGLRVLITGFEPEPGEGRLDQVTIRAVSLMPQLGKSALDLRAVRAKALLSRPEETHALPGLGARFMPPAARAAEPAAATGPARASKSAAPELQPAVCAAAGLSISGWQPTAGRDDGGGRRASEVLLFIHGFNCPTEEALKRLGQLLALGRFPAHIKPVIFSWPTGTIASYFHALRSAASPQLGEDLRACLRSIRDSGVRDVHVLTHSMGAAVFTHALEQIAAEFQSVEDDGTRRHEGGRGRDSRAFAPPWSRLFASEDVEAARDNSQLLRLVTVTMANPEVFEDHFWAQSFPLLCRICRHVTLYGDEDDGALFWSEFVNRKPTLGRLHGAPYRLVPTLASAKCTPNAPSLPKQGASDAWADIDVVDMTWLESNVHALRHNSFGLNRMMVDDLRDVIVERRRAAQRRSRLIRRIGNVFSFLQPPPHVVNS